MKKIHFDTLLCGLILFFAEMRLAVGSKGIDIDFPSFPEDDHLMVFGDAVYNPAHQSHILNAAARKQATGSCGKLIRKQEVRIQEVGTGRVASFKTSFSFSFNTYGEPWDASDNPTAGPGMDLTFASTRSQAWMQFNSRSLFEFEALTSCVGVRNANGIVFNSEYAPYRNVFSNNYIEILKNYRYVEVGNPAYSYNLCGHNRTHCSYFSSGRVFTAWLDFESSSKTLEVRLMNGSQPNVTKPLQPLLCIPNYKIAKELGDEVYLTFWGGSGGNHFEDHEILSWSFSTIGILELAVPSFLSLLQFSTMRTEVGIVIGALGTGVTLAMLWTITLLARSFRRGHYRSGSIRDPAAGPQVFSYAELRRATSNFDASNLLGSGGSGSVHRGFVEGTTWVAVKQINLLKQMREHD